MALNSGLFWPRRSFRRRPGTIRAQIMPVIAPGLSRSDFLERLREMIETRSSELLAEAFERYGHLPKNAEARERLAGGVPWE